METKLRLEINVREPFAEGTVFGDSGTYERIAGSVYFEIDPDDDSNKDIVDLDKAPRNSSGLVEYSSDIYILKPVDLSKGNRRLVHDVNNRGNKRILQFFNDGVDTNEPTTPAHAGNGFLMRRGYSIVWSGWQGDLLPGGGRLAMRLPVAMDGEDEITGKTRMEFISDTAGTTCVPLSSNAYTLSYKTASLDTSTTRFTTREYEADERQEIPADQWQFASLKDGEVVQSSGHCLLPEGFKPGWIYELVYTAKNPPVMGLGFTGLRDLISFLVHSDADVDGTPNPLRQNGTGIEKSYAWGRSQSGRFLRDFVYRGFNADSRGRRVFDGISPHVSGGGRIWLNARFAQPGRHSRQHSDHLFPGDEFPFAYSMTTDALTGKTDSILKRPDTDPLVIHTQTAAEYWERRGSLVHTDSRGNDLGEQDNVRAYLFSSSQHNADPLAKAPQIRGTRYPTNPLNTTPLLRALLDAMDNWATNGTQPPASRVPSQGEENGATADIVSATFPAVPNVECPAEPNRSFVLNFGASHDDGIVTIEPPDVDRTREYTVLVPQVDSDGNDIPGIRTPHVEAPLATHTGWNYRSDGSSGKALAGLVGSHLPFARTASEREASGDPRRSIEERYPTRARYVRSIALAAQKLVEQRLLLEEDADRYVEQAMREAKIG